MTQLKYNIHLLLQSRYKILIMFLIYFAIYISFYGQNIALCMIEEGNIPEIAEAKPIKPRRSNIEQLIHREVTSYLETAQIIETKTQTIVALEAENKQLKLDLKMLAKNYLRSDYDRHDLLGLTTHLDSVPITDPFFREDNSLLEFLKERYPFIFQENGYNPTNFPFPGTNEQERGVPDLLHYGDVGNPRDENADY